VSGRVPQRQPAAGGLAQHRPPVDAQLLPDLLAVGDQVGDGQVRAGRQRRAAVHPALIQPDQQERPAEQVTLDRHEVVAPLAGAAVQEKQRRAAVLAADVDEQAMSADLTVVWPGDPHA
jgi:hypothetical protein